MQSYIRSRSFLWQALATAVLLLLSWFAFAQVGSTGSNTFNHEKTGFALTGNHKFAPCESCHTEGVFRGTPRDCAQCHTQGARAGANVVQSPISHINVIPGVPCDQCHNSTSSFKSWRMNHSATTATCSTCHSGQTFDNYMPTVKGPSHLNTTADCATCHQSTSTFYFAVTYSHPAPVAACETCHNGVTAQGQPIGHIPTAAPCSNCHTSTTSFFVWTMDHTGITSGCAACHNGQSFVGVVPVFKPTGHVPTVLDCSACHTSTVIPGGFKTAIAGFDHVAAGVVQGSHTCTTCHNGVNATGQIGGHIATNAGTQCDYCHKITDASFGSPFWTMDHTQVSTTCASCHASGKTYPGATMVTIGTVSHMPVGSMDCGSCHTSTTTPGGFQNTPMDHTKVTATACATCHASGVSFTITGGALKTWPSPASGHIPTTAACDQCHTSTATGGFPTWTMNHSIVSSTTCATCHSAATGPTFLPSSRALVTTASIASHLPIGTLPCSQCHTSTVVPGGFAQWTMNHSGITGNCSSCHGGTATYTNVTIVTMPVGHVAIGTKDCSICHTSTSVGGFAIFTGIGGNIHTVTIPPQTCISCHGVASATPPLQSAPGMPVGHITTTTTDCGVCHAWNGASFANWTKANIHANVSTVCANCHALGKTYPGIAAMVTTGSVNHMPVTGDCYSCHTTTTVPGGFATWTMQHSAVNTATCVNCHGPAGAGFTNHGTAIKTNTSAGVNHIAFLAGSDCNTCHSTSSFTNFTAWNMNHSSVVTTPCASCHGAAASSFTNNSALPIKSNTSTGVNHIALTNTECSTCHSTSSFTNFSVWTMQHSSVNTATCNNCHAVGASFTNSSATTLKTSGGHFAITGDCNVCHSSLTSFVIASPYSAMVHTGGVNTAGCLSCHGNTPVTFTFMTGGTIAPLARNLYTTGGHATNIADCTPCHTSFTVPGGFFQASGGHTHSTADATQCYSCHSSVGPGKAQIAGHIPTGTTSCDACHTYTPVLLFTSLVSMDHTKVTATPCSTCHLISGNQTIGSSALSTVIGMPTTHIPTTATCNVCHTAPAGSVTAVGTGFKTWTMNHSGVVTTACANCHSAKTFQGLAVTAAYPNSSPTTQIQNKPANHIVTTSDCVNCHMTTTVPGGFAVGTMSHAGIASGCQNCHGTASTTFISATPIKPQGPNHIATVGGANVDCSLCHTVTSVGGFTSWTMNHATTAITLTPCKTCHGGTSYGVTKVVTPLATTSTPSPGHVGVAAGADCSSCHTVYTTGGFVTATKKIGSTGHSTWISPVSTSSNCNTCHGVASALFFGVEYSGQGKHDGGTKTNCGSCHGTNGGW